MNRESEYNNNGIVGPSRKEAAELNNLRGPIIRKSFWGKWGVLFGSTTATALAVACTPQVAEVREVQTPQSDLRVVPTFTPEPTATSTPEPTATPEGLEFKPYGVYVGNVITVDEANKNTLKAIVGKVVIARIADKNKLFVKIARNDIPCDDGTKMIDFGGGIYNLEKESKLSISNPYRDLTIELRLNPRTGQPSLVGSLKTKIVAPRPGKNCFPPPDVVFGGSIIGEGPTVLSEQYARADNDVGESRTTPAIALGQIETIYGGPLPSYSK